MIITKEWEWWLPLASLLLCSFWCQYLTIFLTIFTCKPENTYTSKLCVCMHYIYIRHDPPKITISFSWSKCSQASLYKNIFKQNITSRGKKNSKLPYEQSTGWARNEIPIFWIFKVLLCFDAAFIVTSLLLTDQPWNIFIVLVNSFTDSIVMFPSMPT